MKQFVAARPSRSFLYISNSPYPPHVPSPHTPLSPSTGLIEKKEERQGSHMPLILCNVFLCSTCDFEFFGFSSFPQISFSFFFLKMTIICVVKSSNRYHMPTTRLFFHNILADFLMTKSSTKKSLCQPGFWSNLSFTISCPSPSPHVYVNFLYWFLVFYHCKGCTVRFTTQIWESVHINMQNLISLQMARSLSRKSFNKWAK